MIDAVAESFDKPSDIGTTPQGVARRWKLELKLADKREEQWRRKAKEIYGLYTPDAPAANSFNILWSNTETLRQAVYNSLPQPKVRRRYQDEDPLGKQVSTVLERSLEFSQECYDFDYVLKGGVLSMLLAGRAVSRVRYIPSFRDMQPEATEEAGGIDQDNQPPFEMEDGAEHEESEEPVEGEADEGPMEEIAWEQTLCEQVAYDDFRILCPAKTWEEVNVIAFRHRLTREDLIEKFGKEIGNKIPLESADDEDVQKSKDLEDLFKTAEVWEIWDKDAKQVIFINQGYAVPCKEEADPLGLQGFFPIPRPLYAIENNQTLTPAPLYTQYEQQAKELNRISIRINKLIDGLKLRGIYDSTLSELSNLMEQGDNKMIGAENVTALLERGGLEKAIWMLPIDTAAMVLKELYAHRDACKQVIYEITGIADIMRSASDPNETFGAQKIKTQWGTQRLQRMQLEVQRYIRDIMRLKAELIAEKFGPETLEKMTLVDLPHQAEVDQKNAQMMAQYQQQMGQYQMMMQRGPQQPGQQPPTPPQQPQPENPVTWEQVIETMRDDAARTYHIDIETDSTLAASQEADFEGLTQVYGGIATIFQQFTPLLQAGDLSIDVVKELILVFVRRAKMGSAVEDEIEKIKQPPPRNPEQDKAAAQQQIEQVKAQAKAQADQMTAQTTKDLETFKAQLQDQQHQRELAANAKAAQMQANLDAQLQAHEQQVQAQQNAHQNELESQRAQQQAQMDAQLEAQRQASDERLSQLEQQTKLMLAALQRQTTIEVAEISAKTTLDAAQISAAKQGSE